MKGQYIVVAGAALVCIGADGAAGDSHDAVVCASFAGPRWTDNTWRRLGPRAHEPGSGTLYRHVGEKGYGFRTTAYPVNCALALRWAKKDVREQPRHLYPDTPEADFLTPPGKGWQCGGGLGGTGLLGHTRFTVSGRRAPVGHCETGVDRGSFRWWPADYYDDVQFYAQFGFWPYPGHGEVIAMRLRLACLLPLALAAVAGLSAAAGAFPGLNGTIVFQSANRGTTRNIELWSRSPSGNLKDLTSGGNNFFPAVSPNGKRIAFISDRDGDDEVFVTGIGGGSATQLTHDTTNEMEPAWSPDGKQIAFVDASVGHDEISVMNADGSGEHQLTHTAANAANEEPAWSPDGTRIAYSATRPQEGIYVMNADGSNPVLVTGTTVLDVFPAWSPDSSQIVFASANDLWTVAAGGGAPVQLTHRNIPTGGPHWSPDGSQILFWSRPTANGNDDEFVLDLGTGVVTPLTNDLPDDRFGDWAAADPLTSIAVGDTGCPASTTARLGRVQWNFTSASPHTAVDATGLGLFDAGSHTAPYTFWATLTAAGLYTVDCGLGGTEPSTVAVPMSAAPASGSVSTSFALKWATRPASSGFVYDVKLKAPGARSFATWKIGVSDPSAHFTAPTAGTYAFEARLRRVGGAFTGWSRPLSITVTA